MSRTLLVINLGDPSLLAAPSNLSSSWDLHVINDLNAARKELGQRANQVGLLLLNDKGHADVAEIDALLDAHQSTQWVGVFDASTIKLPAYRSLIVQHLFDFHTWPIDTARLSHTLGHAYGYAELSTLPAMDISGERDMGLVGQSAMIKNLRRQIGKIALTDAPVLIWGESGSGKELAAHAVHNHSRRTSGPFVAVNCGAIPSGLIQSELFGYERGAFSGAVREKKGLIETANGGTLFLDEIGDLPHEMQVNLLRFLQEATINRVGSSQTIKVDVRVIAASHMHLEDAVKSGIFREDLLYRLNVLPLTVPALRERKEDLELLAQHFFKLFSCDKHSRLTGFSNRAMQAIKACDWPGNVRQLINHIRRAMVMAEGYLITPADLGLEMPKEVNGQNGLQNGEALVDARIRAERDAIHSCLQESGSNVSRAARDLGISRMTLYRLMEKHGITP
ncbi:MAG: sigma 54-interacting transcriptional regulator [Rhodoferax sp.]|uniref:sigma-54 dependent transcriptional regulator n=1 Tax=Rhodoferax sp. TaxID=50421 RepID=UPI0026396E7B|nr:sigma-54 dependent transcriptional regulator [Rhodoferax sp.]MDD2879288.1 sigma 54-interacting transcriptional regulator [Rhodoferax sp.]